MMNTSVLQRFAALEEALNSEGKRALASSLGVSRGTWHNYTSGKTAPKLHLLIRLAEGGVNLNWLATGRGTMFGESPLSEEQWQDMRKVVREILGTNQPLDLKADLIVNFFRTVLDTPEEPEDSPIVDEPEADNDDGSAQSRYRKDPA